MVVNWRALVALVILGVAGYYLYDTFWAGGAKRQKMSTGELLKQYEPASTLDRELIYAELKGRVEGKLDIVPLREALKNKDKAPETYKVAAEMIGRAQDRKSVDVLLKDLQGPAIHVQIGAVRAFQHMPCQRAIEPLIKLLNTSSDDLRKEAVVALENAAAKTSVGVRYKAEPEKWKEWWQSVSKQEKGKIPE
jgi:hypothetical protein